LRRSLEQTVLIYQLFWGQPDDAMKSIKT